MITEHQQNSLSNYAKMLLSANLLMNCFIFSNRTEVNPLYFNFRLSWGITHAIL